VNTISPEAAPGEAGRPVGDDVALGLRVDGRVQQLVERGRIDAQHRLLARDQAFLGHVDGDLQRRLGGALAVAGLQHPELAALDGELDVLHVAVVRSSVVADRDEARRRPPASPFPATACRSRGDARASVMSCGVRMPATTSSPWALTRNSP
jgi:hypothetical protein